MFTGLGKYQCVSSFLLPNSLDSCLEMCQKWGVVGFIWVRSKNTCHWFTWRQIFPHQLKFHWSKISSCWGSFRSTENIWLVGEQHAIYFSNQWTLLSTTIHHFWKIPRQLSSNFGNSDCCLMLPTLYIQHNIENITE